MGKTGYLMEIVLAVQVSRVSLLSYSEFIVTKRFVVIHFLV